MGVWGLVQAFVQRFLVGPDHRSSFFCAAGVLRVVFFVEDQCPTSAGGRLCCFIEYYYRNEQNKHVE